MIYNNISSKNNTISSIQNLYESSFPIEERRIFKDVLELLENKSSEFHIMCAQLDDGAFAGFISYWTFDKFIYIEHFAVEQKLRCKNIGFHFLQHFIELHKAPIVLEVEPDINELTHRRINFYIRNGFILEKGFKYVQPPYHKDFPYIDLTLMHNGANLHNHLTDIKQTIHKHVYGVK